MTTPIETTFKVEPTTLPKAITDNTLVVNVNDYTEKTVSINLLLITGFVIFVYTVYSRCSVKLYTSYN